MNSSSSKHVVLCQAPASLKDDSGVLSLTKRKLTFASSKNKTPDSNITISCSTITSLFASKASATNRKLKLVFANGDPYTFTFPNGDDAEKFKGHLSDIVTRNKEKAAAVAAAGNAATTSANGAETPANGPQAESSNAEGSKQAGVGSSQLRSANAQKRRLNKNELKAAVLKRSPELARLHADLVRTGQISEAEFWEGREHLILAEAAADSQRKGKSSLIVDPRPVRDETGKATTKLSNEMIEEIFEEFPVVRRAYDENVPRRLTDQEFWSRYLQSKLASRNSASARGAASEHTVHDDAIFDKYLEKEDDGIEPKYQREHVKRRLVDLDATTQDHPETGNTQDVTMQAGKQRQALPLIRRFNEHSERLLNTALGDEPPAKRRRVTFADELVEDDYVDDIVMEDLHAPLSSNGIPLEMRDQQRYSQGGGSGNAMDVDAGDSLDIKAILPPLVRSLDTWAADMAQACNTVRLERKSVEDALLRMTNNVKSRLETRSKRNEFPEAILNKMTSLQTATSEFLRQFWSAVHPPPPDQGVLSVATPAQLAEREEKMAGYLAKTREKINTIVQTARGIGLDAHRVHTAFDQTMIAVDTALQTHRARHGR